MVIKINLQLSCQIRIIITRLIIIKSDLTFFGGGVKLMEIFLDLIKAFCVGGAICMVGQLLLDTTKLTPGRILVGFVVAGVILTGVGVYEPLVKWAGCGATVPLMGFGYAMADGTKQAIAEEGASGILSGAFTASAAGVTAAIVFGLLASILSKPKEK